ncbi:MAG TPA: hypothetical protein VJ841_02495 [Candidatus Saccharimonadales bacterium]|nr:hypothetical protein [Candidatus Saccharimonadales bacterium]
MVRRARQRQMPFPTTTQTGIDSRYNPTVWYDIAYTNPETGMVELMEGVGFRDDDSPLKMLQRMEIPLELAVITVSKKKR